MAYCITIHKSQGSDYPYVILPIYEKHYYPSGKLDFEATYQDGQLDGVVKKYGENGQVIQQGTFKNGVQVK